MPIMHATRTARSGGLSLAFAVRTLAHGQLSRLIPSHAVGPNIASVVRCLAPFHPITEAAHVRRGAEDAQRDDDRRRDARRAPRRRVEAHCQLWLRRDLEVSGGYAEHERAGRDGERRDRRHRAARRLRHPRRHGRAPRRATPSRRSFSRAAENICGAGWTSSRRCALLVLPALRGQARAIANFRWSGLPGRSS
eukprot:6186839-Pleurochrysis_carterae.AAC.1